MAAPDASAHDVHGIDFSGASDAGRKVWIASGTVEDGELHLQRCRSAATLFGTTDREATHEALVDFLRDGGPTTVGLDAPFSLPGELVDADSWEAFVRGFDDRFDDPEEFRETCLERTDDENRRRDADERVGGLCPYDIRVHKQTFYAIRDVLEPLLDDVSVLPMHDTGAKRTLLEVYPTAVLEQFALFAEGYKESSDRGARRRGRNFDGLERCTGVEYADRESLRETVVENSGGDALDAILAAYAAYDNAVTDDPLDVEYDEVEGYVYT